MRIGRHGLDAAFCGIKVGAADSVGAVVRRSVRIVIRVVRASEAVIVQAASSEMASSGAEVIPADTGDVSSADAADVRCAKPSDAASAETADMATAKAADVTAAEAAHVATTETAAVSAATSAAAGLSPAARLPASNAPAKIIIHRPRMTFLLLNGRAFRHRTSSDAGRVSARQAPTSRWSGDGNCRLRSPLKSR